MIKPNIFLIIERDNAMDRYPHRLLICNINEIINMKYFLE